MFGKFYFLYQSKKNLSQINHFFLRVRGTLITIVVVAECVGNLLVYIIGSFSYDAMSIFPIVIIAISAVLLYFLPETPLYLVKMDKIAVNEMDTYFVHINGI